MTTKGALLDTITMIISDLPKDLPAQQRYQQLLTGMQKVFPFDAAALLKLEGRKAILTESGQALLQRSKQLLNNATEIENFAVFVQFYDL